MNLIKNMDFKCGLIYCFNSQIITFPINSFLIAYNFFTNSNGYKDSINLFNKVFYDDCYIFYKNNFNDKTIKNKEYVISTFLNYLETLGLVSSQIVKLTENKIIISQKNKYLLTEYKKIFNSNPIVPFREFIALFLKSYLQMIYGKKFKYEINSSNLANCYTFTKLSEDFNYSTEKHYSNCCDDKKTQNWIKSLILNKKLNNVSGRIIFNDVLSFGLPIFTYFNLLNYGLKSNLVDFRHLLKSYGFHFSKILELKGFKTPKQKIDYISSYWKLMGFGSLEVLDESYKNYFVETNFYTHFSKFYGSDFFNKLREIHYLNLLGSFEYSFGVKAQSIISEDFQNISFKVISKSDEVSDKRKEVVDLIKNKKGSILY